MTAGRWRWLLPGLAGLLLVGTRVPWLLAQGANNLASRVMAGEWEAVSQEEGPPQCQVWEVAPPAAAEYVAAALRWDPQSERARLNQGRAAWLAGDCAGAVANWELAREAAPGDEIAALWRVLGAGDGVGDRPEGRMARRLARYAHEMGRLGATLAWYRLAFELDPGRETAGRLARRYEREGEVEEAVAVWQSVAAALGEDEAEHWWALAQTAELEGDPARAAWAYRQGVEVAPEPYEFWMAYGASLEGLGQWAEAEGGYRQAVAARPGTADAYMKLGDLRLLQGDDEGAVGWYREARALDGETNPFYLVGVHYQEEGDDGRAEGWLAEAARLDPAEAGAHYALAQSLYRLGEDGPAAASLARAVALGGGKNRWKWAVQLGDWRLALGDRAGALAAYQEALALRPGEKRIEERIDDLLELKQND
jgi:tetratricopeptide (TPR) repeat protein